jgi:hypothetical protein
VDAIMNKRTVIAAMSLTAIIGGVIYLKSGSVDSASVTPSAIKRESGTPVAAARPDAVSRVGSAPQSRAASPALPADPRLAALAVSPDNGVIEFIAGRDGRIVKEIDKDPNSPGFGKPLREYTYVGDKVTGLTSYGYFADHMQVTRTRVSYKPDGSVDQFLESTSYDYEADRR